MDRPILPIFVLTAILETVFNRLLLRDPGMQSARLCLVGKVLCIEILEINAPLFVVFSTRRADILSKWEGYIDCRVKADFSVLYKMRDRQQLPLMMRSGELIVEGNIQVIQQVMTILDPADWDLTEYLTPYLGDIVAQSVEQVLHQSMRFLNSSMQKQQQFWAGMLTEEYKLAPDPLQILWFYEEVDAITSSVDNLSARLAMMEKK